MKIKLTERSRSRRTMSVFNILEIWYFIRVVNQVITVTTISHCVWVIQIMEMFFRIKHGRMKKQWSLLCQNLCGLVKKCSRERRCRSMFLRQMCCQSRGGRCWRKSFRRLRRQLVIILPENVLIHRNLKWQMTVLQNSQESFPEPSLMIICRWQQCLN